MSYKCYHCNKEIPNKPTLFKHKDANITITFCDEHYYLSHVHKSKNIKFKKFDNFLKKIRLLYTKNNSRVHPL